MTKPKPKPASALEAVQQAVEAEENKRADKLKPIELIKVALCAYQAYSFSPTPQPSTLTESDDRTSLRRGTQAAMDRMLFNVNYWRSAYENRIVSACASKEDAQELLRAISAWNTHTMKLNTLYEPQVIELFERFCPPLSENNRRGSSKHEGRGKGPVADFILQAKSVAPHLSEEKRASLEHIVFDVEREARAYAHFKDTDALDALYELLPVWCLQDKIELVAGNWWNDADIVLYMAEKLSEHFARLGHAEAYCSYFTDMVNEALDGYMKEIADVDEAWSTQPVDALLKTLSDARKENPNSETDGYGAKLPAWLSYKEQLIWNIIVCAIYGPQHARPFMADSLQTAPLDGAGNNLDVITSMARNAYGHYLALRRSSNANTEYDSFEQLPEDLHHSSLERIMSIPERLRTLGYRIVPAASCYPEQRIEAFAPSEVEVLAILEHRRWCEERTAAGWQFASEKSVDAKQSPYLIEWENLPERAREWNRCSARDIPTLLASEGLAISK